jgi:hypothetical protein
MEFIDEVTPTSQNEPRIKVSIDENQINEIVTFPYYLRKDLSIFKCFGFDESDYDDLVLFGVGGPA